MPLLYLMDSRAAVTAPFSLLELTTRRGIASILSRPRWWDEWQDEQLRAKFLDDVQLKFLQ
jgi:hypothetical protein